MACGVFKDKTGEINYNRFGTKMIITRYKNYHDCDIYFPKYDYTLYNTGFDKFLEGVVKCPFDISVYGKGYLGTTEVNKEIYTKWRDMLERCYSELFHKKHPTYEKCIVCDDWLNFSNFQEWYKNNYYEIEGEKVSLDKDLLMKGNKIYSPNTCCFLPQRLNSLIINCHGLRGGLPLGVHWSNKENKYIAQMSKGIGKNIRLGRFDTPKEAFQSYKIAKESYIKEMADQYKEVLKPNVYKSLHEFEVSIDD